MSEVKANIYYEKDADLSIMEGKTVAVIGYGSQGHAQAQNLNDSGVSVVVAEVPGSAPWKQAQSDGLKVATASDAAAQGEVIIMLVPDELQAKIYKADIEPNLSAGKTLMFSHGFNIHFSQIVPPTDVDVSMIAPKSPGHLLRRVFVGGQGVPALLAVHQDPSGKAKQNALAYAKGIGSTRAGVIETTFREETETDLFGEQTVLCGGITALMFAGFDTLVEAGYQPEIAYFEILHEMKLIVDLIYEGGIAMMRYSVSDTATYGDLSRGRRVINEGVREEMRRILKEIQNGEFAREWILENQAGRPTYNALHKSESEHPIERIGAELRDMMSWLEKSKTD